MENTKCFISNFEVYWISGNYSKRNTFLTFITLLLLLPILVNGQPSLPYYGNWCGIGHGAGYPIDELDCACMDHDIDYEGSNYAGRLATSDQRLVARAKYILRKGWMERYAPLRSYAFYRGKQIIAYTLVARKPLSSSEREKLRAIIAYGTTTQIVTYPHQQVVQQYNYGRQMIRKPSGVLKHTENYIKQRYETEMGLLKSGGTVLENTAKSTYKESKRTLRKITGIKF